MTTSRLEKNPALIIFGRNPISGHVKTRLAMSIGDDAAANLYRAFLLDSLAAFSRSGVDVRLYLHTGQERLDRRILEANPVPFVQSGLGLGERMNQAFSESFAEGYERVAIVGSDHPSLPTEEIERGLALISDQVVVIGPSLDGGFYFLGLSKLRPELFEGVRYGENDVLDATVDRVRALDLSPVLLRPWYDIDTMEDLGLLRSDLLSNHEACPRSSEVMKHLGIM
jgi:rSAM/selenodomain-associated transferase 1